MITGLKNVMTELLGTVSRFFFIGSPFGSALRQNTEGYDNRGIDVTDGNGGDGEASEDWQYSVIRFRENIVEGSSSPNYEYDWNVRDGHGDWNNGITLFDLMGRIADIEFAIDGDTLPSVTYMNKFGIVHTSGAYNEGTVLYCRKTGAATYDFLEISKDICKAIITRDATGGTLALEADWLYEWNGSVWRKKCDQAAATPGVRVIREDFTYTNGTTPGSSATIPIGAIILKVEVILTTYFNTGNSASVQVNGGGINSIMPNTVVSPGVPGLYITDYTNSSTHKAVATSNTGVTVTIVNGGSSQGAGYALVYFVEPEL